MSKGEIDYKGKLYAKVGSKYIECTETIQDLENKIEKLKLELASCRNGDITTVEIAKIIAHKAGEPANWGEYLTALEHRLPLPDRI